MNVKKKIDINSDRWDDVNIYGLYLNYVLV